MNSRVKCILFSISSLFMSLSVFSQTGKELTFQTWALTPPMGWNSWDCYGPTVVEDEVKANADYLAEHLSTYGWEYVVVDIRWYVENDKSGGYNQTDPIYVYDEWGRYTPALNRFPSAADGVGFKALSDYVHNLGLKFGIHLMRGLPKVAAAEKLPVKGTNGITCDMICNNDSACTWLSDNYKVDYTKEGAQEYYNSCFELYASWGVDYVKVDDLSRPYHTAEIQMIRNAIDSCGREIVLSISPGETPLEKVEHVKNHANLWRTVDDFWDNWSQLSYQFEVCAKWAPYIAPGTWPDADMLPLGKISIRGERGDERWTNFTTDEQRSMMNLWTIFKSPLMFGGDLPQNDAATDSLLTNVDVLYMHHYSANNRELSNKDSKIIWAADDPACGDKFVALFNTGGSDFVNTQNALYRSGSISHLTTGFSKQAEVDLSGMKGDQLALVVTDDGDGYDCDHADWINPIVTLSDGSIIKLTDKEYLRGTCGWGSIAINKNLEGGSLSINGTTYNEGIATHANSIILYQLPENAVTFSALVGIDNTGSDQGSDSSVEFLVFDGDPTIREETTDANTGGGITINIDPAKQIACSGFISHATNQTKELSADITGAEKLYLVVTNGGDDLSYDHADWANPVLVDIDGNEFSLTDLNWDEDPVNGWYAPKLNTNNDGNVMTMDGIFYDKGFGVNAPSILTFTLPEGHNYVMFKATVGYDDDVANVSSGVTMEFRVFVEDPTPDTFSAVELSLTELGYSEDQDCTIQDMWSGQTLGIYANSSFAPILESHASGLYRVSAVERTNSATVHISVSSTEQETGQPFDVCIEVSGGENEGAYVQLLSNGNIIGTLTLESDGTAVYTASLPAGEYVLQAKYSGTTSVALAISSEITVSVTGEDDTLSKLRAKLLALVNDAQTIDLSLVAGTTRAPLTEALVAATPVEGQTQEELQTNITVLSDVMDAARLTMSKMAELLALIEEAEEFAATATESDAKTALVNGITEALSIYQSDSSTVDDIATEIDVLQELLDTCKKQTEPAEGEERDMTEYLVNPSFEEGTNGWTDASQYTGWISFAVWSDRPAADGTYFISVNCQNIVSIDFYQDLYDMPAGTYRLEAALRNTDGANFLTDQHIYATAGANIYTSDVLSEVSGDNNNDWYVFSISDILLSKGETLRIGAASTGTDSGYYGWFQADDFRLYYQGSATAVIPNPTLPNDNDLLIQPIQGGINVSTTVTCTLPLYSLDGVLQTTLDIAPGVRFIPLRTGFYVLGGKAILVK